MAGSKEDKHKRMKRRKEIRNTRMTGSTEDMNKEND
jgi:hypothetical protein